MTKVNKHDYYVKGTTRHVSSSIGLGGFPIDKTDIPFKWTVFLEEVSASGSITLGIIE